MSAMLEWLNYHHLLYFWTVAKEGSIARASKSLRLTQPTISEQIRALETALGERLFQREGRGLQLTEMGQTVFRYAEEIFALGRELQDTLRGRPTGRPSRFVVGIADSLPKWVSYQLLQPAFALNQQTHVVCRQDKSERLLADLAVHTLDLVLSDVPLPPGANVRAFNHLLGECGVTFFGSEALAGARKSFPQSLDGAPMLLPAEGTALRRSLAQWFDTIEVRPRVIAECDDSALLKVFGQGGLGIIAVPTVAEKEVREHYDLRVLGRTDEVRERFYAISLERKLKHPAVVAISTAARGMLFVAT